MINLAKLYQGGGVLIETLWNVKHYCYSVIIGAVQRINRNIVECKDIAESNAKTDTASINRNIVECKESRKTRACNTSKGINRNIVECKETVTPSSTQQTVRINRNIVECKDVRVYNAV